MQGGESKKPVSEDIYQSYVKHNSNFQQRWPSITGKKRNESELVVHKPESIVHEDILSALVDELHMGFGPRETHSAKTPANPYFSGNYFSYGESGPHRDGRDPNHEHPTNIDMSNRHPDTWPIDDDSDKEFEQWDEKQFQEWETKRNNPAFLAAHNRDQEAREKTRLAMIAKNEQHMRERAMDEEKERFNKLRIQNERDSMLYGMESSEAGTEYPDTTQTQSAKIKRHMRERAMEEEKERVHNLGIRHARDANHHGMESSEPGAKTRNSRTAENFREMEAIDRIKSEDIMRNEVADMMTQSESTHRTEHQNQAMMYVQQQHPPSYSRRMQSAKSEAGNRAAEKRLRSKNDHFGEL
jgi:hypothetical protein